MWCSSPRIFSGLRTAGLAAGAALACDLVVAQPGPQIGCLTHVVRLVESQETEKSAVFAIESGYFFGRRRGQHRRGGLLECGCKGNGDILPGSSHLFRRRIFVGRSEE